MERFCCAQGKGFIAPFHGLTKSAKGNHGAVGFRLERAGIGAKRPRFISLCLRQSGGNIGTEGGWLYRSRSGG